MVKLARLLLCLSAVAAAFSCGWAQEVPKDQAKCYLTWDDSYLYAGFKVDCPDVRGTHRAPNADVAGDDLVAIYVLTADKPTSSITPRCFTMAVSAAGGGQFSVGTDKGVFEPKTVLTFKYGAYVQGTLNNGDDVDQGYNVEIALPWELMNTKAPRLGDMMRFNIVLRRHDGKPGEFVSLSSRVKTEEDVLDPSKWMSLVFATYSFGAVMPGGEKVVCARSLGRPPLINGRVEDLEWSKNMMFAIDLPTPAGFVYEAKYPVQRLVFTHYFYWYQADPRKAAPVGHITLPDGTPYLQHFPIKGVGPWFSSDRVQWHKEELSDIVAAGIDVVLPIYWGDRGSRSAWSAKGLDCMISALQELHAEGKHYPRVAMFFDTTAMELAYGTKPNLKEEEVKRTFYGMIKDFFDRIPREYRAFVQSGKPNAGRPGCVVFLYTSNFFSDLDDGFVTYCNERFERDFGCPLIWIAAEDFKTKASSFDGYSSYGAGLGPICLSGGRIRIGAVGAGFDDTASAIGRPVRIRSRMGGETYEKDWARVLETEPQWVVCDGWNELHEGSELCATRQYGRKYIDATRANVKRFAGGVDFDAQYLRCDLPRIIAPRQIAQAELVIRNAGNVPWRSAQGYALAYRWYKSGRYLAESKVRRTLDRDVLPGESVTVQIGIATVSEKNAPLPEGDCEVRFEMVRLEDNKWFSALGAQPLIMPVTIGTPPDWAASYLTCDAPVLMASGCAYPVRVRVRNDGTQRWPRGVVKMSCRLFKISNYTHDNPLEFAEEVPIKQIRALLAKDCRPGEIAEFILAINLVHPDGKPVPNWSPDQPWSYQLRFDIYNGSNWLSEHGSPPLARIVDVFDRDWSARIVDSNVPPKLTAGQVFEAKVVIRNVGAVRWERRRTAVGCHWFHLDGTQMQWDCPTTPIGIDVKPGWPIVATARIKAPEYDGRYILAWDVMIDGVWLSTLPITRGGDLLPVFVEVTGGKLAFVDLAGLYDISAFSFDTDRSKGDFNGAGLSFPAELVPPDAAPQEGAGRVYPSGYQWDREPHPDGRISFLYPDKLGAAKNALSCSGQKLAIEPGRYIALHILGASSNGAASGRVLLGYADGTSDVPLTMSDWTAGPKLGERIGLVARHLHGHGGDQPGKSGYLYHYVVGLDSSRTLANITLPKAPDMKVVAVTLERLSLPNPKP